MFESHGSTTYLFTSERAALNFKRRQERLYKTCSHPWETNDRRWAVIQQKGGTK